MDWFTANILRQLEIKKCIGENDLEVYRFGLECILLKALHIISYLLIGLWTGEILSLMTSATVLIPIRRKSGGYHAKTRMGCYIFSCCTVFLLSLCNKITFYFVFSIAGLTVADTLILLFAPVENENRELEVDERLLFGRQARRMLVIANSVIAVIYLTGKSLFLAHWLSNGVIFAGMLLFMGMYKQGLSRRDCS